jgi:ABC-type lipoprotein export system ATPase subunit
MSTAIEVADAYRIYDSDAGGTPALQGLTLALEPGEIVVVLGPSGSGKTTLLRVLAGLERLSAGSASVFGTDVARLGRGPAAAFRAANVGLLDQHYAQSLSTELTCRQSVALQLGLLGGDPQESARAADSLLDRVGLGDRAESLPSALSGGEQQRVALCAAVAHGPRLLLADEPAGELDDGNAALVYQLLGELVRTAGATALIVSHDRAAAGIADRLVHIRDGRLVEQSRPGGPPSLVVARGGWVRLPEPLLRALGDPALVSADQADGQLVLSPAGASPPLEREVPPAPSSQGDEGDVLAELRGVGKRYSAERPVLGDLRHEFEAGRFHVVIGRSGSGKTTLLHLLAGLERPTEGEVLLAGEPLRERDRTELARLRRRHVALVTQEPGLVPYLSAVENVELALSLRGVRDGADARARDALAAVGLARRLDSRASRLSAGERQRVAIARALAVGAPLLLADEPTARLDQENAQAVAALLADAAHERGLAVVCATHDPAVIGLADGVVRLGEA